MEDQIVVKLRRELERPITEEPPVVYLLVEIRKLMEQARCPKKKKFFFFREKSNVTHCACAATGAVHVELSGDSARRIVKHIDALYPRLLNGQLTDEDKHSMRAFFSIVKFRRS